jgi:hypothetical protein
MTNLDEYTYEVIDNENDARVCAQLLSEEFIAHNSMIIFDGLTSERMFNEDTWPSMIDVLNERLSFLARHRHSGRIVATICACDLYLAQQKHPYDSSSAPSTIPFFDLLDEMDQIFLHQDFGQQLKPNMFLQIIMGATLAEHSNKGVATQLRSIMCKHARDIRGFQYALAQTTNQATRHIYMDKMGGKQLTVVDPTTWIWKKKGDEICPYKDYKGGAIPNILIRLTSINDN